MDNLFNIYTISMLVVFIFGYALIALEHVVKINKTTIALLMAIICWILQFANHYEITQEENLGYLEVHIGHISQVIFFLLGALSVVELINVHHGFKIISNVIQVHSKKKMLWVLGFVTFFLSAILDNLTTTIVMISLLQKLVENREDRLIIGGGIVIAANAGGAWTPIGDVTTTMLWIGGQITTGAISKSLFFPSMTCFIASFLILHRMLKGDVGYEKLSKDDSKIEPQGELIFFLGMATLIFVPVFKMLTGLLPFMGILFGLGLLWLITDIVHYKEQRHHLRVPHVFTKIDLSGVLFFFGILLCVDALETAGLLERLALWLDSRVGRPEVVATMVGMASAIIDNVPLVAASMGMYSLEQYPQDSSFWKLIAYCAGVGGSMLVIGSAAGVVFMGLEKVDFFWYLRKISFAAAVGYFMGIGVYLLLSF